jgi:hypothetical protein
LSDESFLSRWSRRKAAERRGDPEPEVVPSAEAVTAAAPAPAQVAPQAEPVPEVPPLTLEDAAKLTPADDFSAFVARGVDETVKRAALKKLFADPHFNVMDGLDTYIDDYSQPDPIPLDMLRELRHTAELRLFDPVDDDTAAPAVGDARRDEVPAVAADAPPDPPEPQERAQASPHGEPEPPSVE